LAAVLVWRHRIHARDVTICVNSFRNEQCHRQGNAVAQLRKGIGRHCGVTAGVHRFVAGVARVADGLDGPSSSATVK